MVDGSRKLVTGAGFAAVRPLFLPLSAAAATKAANLVDDHLTATPQEFLELDDDDASALMTARYYAVCALGCDFEAAVVVAIHPEIGVDEACDLIRRGCDPRTAIRILR